MKKPISHFIKFIINILCVLLFFLPLSDVFSPENYKNVNKGWEQRYLYNSLENLILILPFFITWAWFQLTNTIKVKIRMKTISLYLSGLYLCSGFMCMPAQDHIAGPGMLILSLFFPLIVLMTFFEKKDTQHE